MAGEESRDGNFKELSLVMSVVVSCGVSFTFGLSGAAARVVREGVAQEYKLSRKRVIWVEEV